MRNQNLLSRLAVMAAVLLPLVISAGCSKKSGTGPGDTTAPTVSSTVPLNLEVGCATNAAIVATFSEAMDPATISVTSFTLKHGATSVAGAVTYTGVAATFVPTSGLSANTAYTATITTAAQDVSGNALENDYVWGFSTGTLTDVTPPTVTLTVPVNLAVGRPTNTSIAATFSEGMAPATISTASFTVKQGATSVAGTVTYTGATATFAPASNLAANTIYTATITTGAKDLAGNAMENDYIWSFTTGAQTDVTPPTVSSTVPPSGTNGVAIGANIVATFSEAMSAPTLTTTTFTLKQGSTSVVGTVVTVGAAATFNPASNLAPNASYTATIKTGVKDLAGNAIAAIYQWTFSTGAAPDITPPTLVSTAPVSGATSVPIDATISAAFSEALNPLTITTATFTLQHGTIFESGSVNVQGATANFFPVINLVGNTVYTATITTGVADLSGNALVSSHVWTFTTAPGPDMIPPEVSSTLPIDGATNVAITDLVKAVFTEPLNPATVTIATFRLKLGATVQSGSVSYLGNTATFIPSVALEPNTIYTAEVTTGVRDLAGNSLASTFVWTFATAAVLDVTRPTVSFTAPDNAATNVAIDADITAIFSESMNPATISTTSFILTQGGSPVSGTVIYVGATATFNPTADLAHNTLYTARITTAATDSAGNALSSDYVWSFTSGASADVSAPTVASTTPSNTAVGVATNGDVSVVFSEAMRVSTINSTSFVLKQGTTVLAGVISYGGITATFNPTLDLLPNTVYTVTITTDARDLAGNALATAKVWTFTTGPDNVAPIVLWTVPIRNNENVPVDQNVDVNFSEKMNQETITTSSFMLSRGSISVSGVVVHDAHGANADAEFIPTDSLLVNTVYTATITTAVTDDAGNHMASNYTWNFTTSTAPVLLGHATGFVVLAGTTVASTGATSISGDVGVSPGNSVSGFPPGTISGTTHSADAEAVDAKNDLSSAYGNAAARSTTPFSVSGNIGGRTLAPGLYRSTGTLDVSSGDLTLDGRGNANAVFIFQIASTFTVSDSRHIILTGGMKAANVFWQVGGSATLGAGADVKGTILANESITLGAGTTLVGRALARSGSVTLNANTITKPTL
jgi:hypothetical protein